MRQVFTLPLIWFIGLFFINGIMLVLADNNNEVINTVSPPNNSNNNNDNNIKIVQHDELRENLTSEYNTTIYHHPYINYVAQSALTNPNNNTVDPNNNNTNTSKTPGDDASLEEQLKDDQLALKRMVMILSLVGGLGALAIITTLIIFAKLRSRKQKLGKEMSRRSEDEHNHYYRDNGYQDYNNNSNNNNNNDGSISTTASPFNEIPFNSNYYPPLPQRRRPNDDENRNPQQPSLPQRRRYDNTNNINNDEEENGNPPPSDPQPSAPPSSSTTSTSTSAAFVPTLSTIPIEQQQRQRQHTFIQAQQSSSLPMPSAPSAKELDYQGENRVSIGRYPSFQHDHENDHYFYQSQQQQPSSSSSQSINHPLIPPDLPPPAYTASAPPLYDRPIIQLDNITPSMVIRNHPYN
ncbi:hypothetical protein BJ944DRAFT_252615 [Cunninghamella echinulata]|nr:hypothetical protein BJ944DRAFT_252615 [Cunninghamella echinulata]